MFIFYVFIYKSAYTNIQIRNVKINETERDRQWV